MDIKNKDIYFKNTLTRRLEIFKPNSQKKVGMYHCGPTVYNRAHLGNLTAYIFADVLRRFFEELGYEVKQVINITDVGHLTDDANDGEDKMESQAKKTGEKITSIAEKYTNIFVSDLKKLNIDTSKILFPKATEHISEQIDLILKMEKAGYTYKTSDGIYYNTKKYVDYGILGGINIEGLKEGARIAVNSEKINSTDFALWKFSKKDEHRQQEWESPWGIGFPGWHIECSAMSRKYLGPNFDIHTGGIEHIPIHHNNEIAQSVASDNQILANYWLHLNHLMLNGSKISKSLGNVIYTDHLEKENLSIAVFRYWFLTSHYSTSSNFSWEALRGAQKPFDRIVKQISNHLSKNNNSNFLQKIIRKPFDEIDKIYYEKALSALKHDMGTPEAIAVISEIINDVNLKEDVKAETILKIDKILGIGFEKIAQELLVKNEIKNKLGVKIPNEIIELAEMRKKARLNKDFEAADNFRKQIMEKGYAIVDKNENYEINKSNL